MDGTPRASRGLPAVGLSIRHHVVVIVVAAVLAVGFAGLYVASMSVTYTAAAVVLLRPAPGNPLTAEAASGSGIQLTVAMETEAELVPTLAVRDAVSEELRRSVLDETERLTVDVPANTQMLEIAFTSRSPRSARDGAQDFADGYLAYRSERANATQEATFEALGQQVEATDANLRRATAQASAAESSSYASQEVQLLAARLAQLNNALSTAEAVSTDPGVVITPAELPSESDGLPAWIFIAAAAGLGVLGGVGVAVLREWRHDLVRSDEVDELGVPVFSTVRWSGEPQLASTMGGSVHEAYRRLRSAIIANGARPHVLAVTGVGMAPSSVVANLAVVLAEARFSVLLIVTAAEHAEAESMLGVGRQPGLSEVLEEGRCARGLLHDAHGVRILTCGLDPDGARDLLANPVFPDMVDDLRQDFDYVLLGAAPTGSSDSDAVLLAADSTLLALTADRTTRAQLQAAQERFERLGITTVGAVKVTCPKRGPAVVGGDVPADRTAVATPEFPDKRRRTRALS